jgi:cytochrome c peroxidase
MSAFRVLKRLSVKNAIVSAGVILASAGIFVLHIHFAKAQSSPNGNKKPGWLASTYSQALHSPLPITKQSLEENAGSIIPEIFPIDQKDTDPTGVIETLNTAGPTVTAHNAFFQSLGSNGRSCNSCHQPSSGMTISVDNIRTRYLATRAKDPLFAPVDGANCPDAVAASDTRQSPYGNLLGHGPDGFLAISDPRNPRSLLLNRGVIRIFLPYPPKNADGQAIVPEFSLEVLRDPTGCLINKNFGLTSPTPVLSVYRRPLITGNLKFVTTIDPTTGTPLPNDPFTGLPESGNIMWDGREPTLESQATNATLIHAQALQPPTAQQVAEMVQFENSIFSAQSFDFAAHSLTALGATGGPVNLSAVPAGQNIPFDEYSNWASLSHNGERAAQRESVARGEAIFNTRTFTISNVTGLNDVPGIGNNIPGTCSSCHATKAGTIAIAQGEIDQGTTGTDPAALPAPDLPLLKLTCPAGSRPFGGTTVLTHDLGRALLTGKCVDIGKIKIPQLRGLAARAPYFHDGSAANLREVIEFYDRRFSIGFTDQETQDLINFLRTL